MAKWKKSRVESIRTYRKGKAKVLYMTHFKEYQNALKGVTFIDLFAGIGGFHTAMAAFGAECVFSSEWDKYAQITYQENYDMLPAGDITEMTLETFLLMVSYVPDFLAKRLVFQGNNEDLKTPEERYFLMSPGLQNIISQRFCFWKTYKNSKSMTWPYVKNGERSFKRHWL